ncbi:serine/threonine-protein kinase [Tsukamurella pseudospumae]|uniref:non-specific serine/threonine protein kinase n=1 Tax=Tsukamurella pseudospumae TaxID=239498 RepID=A0A137ZI15_9ACTN|nr:serine/threonine-protein kinase [Tsukamurella pseudospumae]KXO97824.1 hypothetical protein AXK61_21670 [Tsukamurella pseudospumae]
MEAGEVLDGRYELLSTLGRGGMGVVWLARHQWLTNREYAVKVIADHIVGDPDAVARFTREARAMADLGGHPNVAEVLDFGVDGSGRFYLVMELLAGQDLSALIGRGPLTPENALRIVSEAAAGLAHAHAAGLVHRDVKPANLFVAGDGAVRVLDFGLARAVDGSGTVTRGAGTWQYMAPEQFDDDFGQVSPATDVYGLTGVLLQAVTGRPPFPGATSMPQLYVAHTRRPRPRPGELDPKFAWLDSVIARGMAIDSSERFQSTDGLARAAMRAWRGDAEMESAQRARPPESPPLVKPSRLKIDEDYLNDVGITDLYITDLYKPNGAESDKAQGRRKWWHRK